MRESVPTARYSPVCNVLRQWKTSLILTYRVYRLYDNYTKEIFINNLPEGNNNNNNNNNKIQYIDKLLQLSFKSLIPTKASANNIPPTVLPLLNFIPSSALSTLFYKSLMDGYSA